jgi:hypothetical protein
MLRSKSRQRQNGEQKNVEAVYLAVEWRRPVPFVNPTS